MRDSYIVYARYSRQIQELVDYRFAILRCTLVRQNSQKYRVWYRVKVLKYLDLPPKETLVKKHICVT